MRAMVELLDDVEVAVKTLEAVAERFPLGHARIEAYSMAVDLLGKVCSGVYYGKATVQYGWGLRGKGDV